MNRRPYRPRVIFGEPTARYSVPRPLILDPEIRAQARRYLDRAERQRGREWLRGVAIEATWYVVVVGGAIGFGLWIVRH